MKTVYGYIRVSTAKQGEGVSLIAQKESIERYALQHNLNIVQWFEEKETAAKQGRPLFNAMLKLIKAKKADGIIIHKIDRGARNLKDWAEIGELIEKGIEIHFAHESLDLQARGGRLSADIQAVIAADFIRNQRQEVIKGIYGRLNQGIYPFEAPTGYLDTGKGKCKLIDPVQGPFVRMTFELYATKRYGLITLSEHMDKAGLRNKRNKKVCINSLSLILNNPYYMGIIRVKGQSFQGHHQALISPNLFKRVQAILKGKSNQKLIKHDFKFKRLIKCKGCGYTLIAETQKGNTYYRCHSKNCITKGLREQSIERTLINKLSAVQLHRIEDKHLHSLLNETKIGWAKKQSEILNGINLQIGKNEQRLERLTDCYLEEGMDKEMFERRKNTLLIELKNSTKARDKIVQGKEGILQTANNFLELVKSLTGSYKIGISEEKRQLVEIVTSNFVAQGKNLVITMRKPFSDLAERHFLLSGDPQRGKPRQMEQQFVDTTKEEIIPEYKPLTKEQLRPLWNTILDYISQLPADSLESMYGL